jgi:hypothetical protein
LDIPIPLVTNNWLQAKQTTLNLNYVKVQQECHPTQNWKDRCESHRNRKEQIDTNSFQPKQDNLKSDSWIGEDN